MQLFISTEKKQLTTDLNSQTFRFILAQVRVRAASGLCVDKAALEEVFYLYFGFPCQLFHQFLHHNHPGLAQ
jgi:hypothetical protein